MFYINSSFTIKCNLVWHNLSLSICQNCTTTPKNVWVSSFSLTHDFTTPFSLYSISDDDEVPPLSTKFGDIYPMSGYEDPGIVASTVNGLHSELNGGGENVALKEGVSPTW